MAAYFVRYNCPECGDTHEIHNYLFSEDIDLDGQPISEVMFEDQFLRFRSGVTCAVTGKAIGLDSEQFTLVNTP